MDVIVLLDVIEHLPSPRDTLALCARHLNPGGIIVLTTGDFGSLCARLAGARWRLMTPPQHLWFFTRESMRRLAASARHCGSSIRSSVEDRPAVADHVPARRMLGRRPRPRAGARSRVGLPVNLFDAMRVVLRKPAAEPAMSDRLSLAQIVASWCAYAVGMAGGQLLFKMAALRCRQKGRSSSGALGLLLNGYFLVALVLYARARRCCGCGF